MSPTTTRSPGPGAACSCRRAACRPHFVKAAVRVHAYPDGTTAVFLGPHRLATYDADGKLVAAPAATSLAPGSSASRAGLAAPRPGTRPARRPPSTRPSRGAPTEVRAGTKKRVSTRAKRRPCPPLEAWSAAPSTPSGAARSTATKATDHELPKHDKSTRYGQRRSESENAALDLCLTEFKGSKAALGTASRICRPRGR